MPSCFAFSLVIRATVIAIRAAAAYEAGLKERTVISEFPSVEQAIAAHDGAAYQAALRALGDGADREIRIVEGVE